MEPIGSRQARTQSKTSCSGVTMRLPKPGMITEFDPREPLQPRQHARVNAVPRKTAEGGNEREMRDQRHGRVLPQHTHAAQAHRHGVDEERIRAFRDRDVMKFREPVNLIGDVSQINLGHPRFALGPAARFAQSRGALGERAPVGIGEHLVVLGDIEAAEPALIARYCKGSADRPIFGLITPKKIGRPTA